MNTRVLSLRDKLVRLYRFEYWPWYVFYLPVVPLYFYYALRLGRLRWFRWLNPCMEEGGWQGERKSCIQPNLPAEYLPPTLLWVQGRELSELPEALAHAGVTLPLVAKPDVGERGTGIRKLDTLEQVRAFLGTVDCDYLLQTWVDLPLELGAFLIWQPATGRYRLTSLCEKRFLAVTGTGSHTIAQLMQQSPRAHMQLTRLQNLGLDTSRISPAGETVALEPIGNHSRGTVFLNVNAHITPAAEEALSTFAQAVQGFHYGRVDLRAASYAALEQGRFTVLELNGVTSEPGHIYGPGYPLWRAWRDVLWHWQHAGRIALHLKRANEGS